eukprot:GILI01016097.1.p1 GENE.GILI01016097.1~~GILI01016097.1.p1  ORF type:complete len:315 (-),score=122.67 GILI01016097.1:267-1124(-)
MADAIGIMEGAFFVGRNELLSWINSTFRLNLVKIEQVASGAVHCQIMDAIFPGKVPMHKVNWAAKHEYEFVKNFKILQEVFDRCGISKHIDVEKLIKAKYQDNLEFLQWMKRYYDLHCGATAEYDAVERRKGAALEFTAGAPASAIARAVSSASVAAAPRSAAASSASASGRPASAAASKSSAAPAPMPLKKRTDENVAPAAASSAPRKAAEKENDSQRVQELMAQMADLKLTIDGLEKERDFYFGKLRDIEILCQNHEGTSIPVLQEVTKILYATDDDFVQADA